jgi:hypothetical protein
MHEYDKYTDNNHNSPSKIDEKFLDALSKFIQSVESEIDNAAWICLIAILIMLQDN